MDSNVQETLLVEILGNTPECPSFEALIHQSSDHMGGGSSFYYLDTTTCWSVQVGDETGLQGTRQQVFAPY